MMGTTKQIELAVETLARKSLKKNDWFGYDIAIGRHTVRLASDYGTSDEGFDLMLLTDHGVCCWKMQITAATPVKVAQAAVIAAVEDAQYLAGAR